MGLIFIGVILWILSFLVLKSIYNICTHVFAMDFNRSVQNFPHVSFKLPFFPAFNKHRHK